MARNTKIEKRTHRKLRVRSKVNGNADRPRMSIFRSNQHVFVQIIDDIKNTTLVSASDKELEKGKGVAKRVASFMVGELLAKKALALKIKKVAFDKGGFMYHGRVKEIAEGARKGGLDF